VEGRTADSYYVRPSYTNVCWGANNHVRAVFRAVNEKDEPVASTWTSKPDGLTPATAGGVSSVAFSAAAPGQYKVTAVSDQNRGFTDSATVDFVKVEIKALDEPGDILCAGGTRRFKAEVIPSSLSGAFAWSVNHPDKLAFVDGDNTAQTIAVTGLVASAAVNAEELKVEFTPTAATFTCTATTNLTVFKVDIKRNGIIITDTTADVNVGEKIALEGVVQPPDLGLLRKWGDIPGEFVVSYMQTLLSAETEHDYNPYFDNINFHWIDRAENATVTYKLLSSDPLADEEDVVLCQASAHFNVHKPTSVFNSTLTNLDPPVGVREGGEHPNFGTLLEFGDVYAEPGIAWPNSVTTWAHGGGNVQIVQLIEYNASVIGDTHRFETVSPGFVLDAYHNGSLAYEGVIRSIADGATGSLQNFVIGIWVDLSDSPGALLDFLDNDLKSYTGIEKPNVHSYSRKDRFTTYLMYRPTGEDSIWVTLRKMTWFWEGSAVKTDGVWTLVEGSGKSPDIPPAGSETHELPAWQGYFEKTNEENTVAIPLAP
jgi:hypothetical protein